MANIIESGDKLLKELLETETQMANETLGVLKSRYLREKKQWSAIYEQKQSEISALKEKLSEMEKRLTGIRSEYSKDKLEEMEKIKASIEEQKELKLKDQVKWDAVESEVSSFKKIADEAQVHLTEERKRSEHFQGEYLKEEIKLRDKLIEKEKQVSDLHESLHEKERDWYKARAKFEESIAGFNEKLTNVEESLKNEREANRKVVSEKDTKFGNLQKVLQEITVELNEQKRNNNQLKNEIKSKEKQILTLGQENRKNLEEIEIQRDEWKRAWQKEQEEWEKYKNDLLEREKNLKFETESQISRLMLMMKSLESELDDERKTNNNLKTQVSEKDSQLKAFREELELLNKNFQNDKNNLQLQLKSQEEFFLRDKKDIVEQYEKNSRSKEESITKLQQDMSQLRNKYSDLERVLKLERNEMSGYIAQNDKLKEEIRIIENKLDKETSNYRESILQEQMRYEEKVGDINIFAEKIQNGHKEELKQLNSKLVEITGEFNELRMIYQETKLENQQYRLRQEELEKELQKRKEKEIGERNEWEKILSVEQQGWEKRRNDLIAREESIVKERDREIEQLGKSVEELTKKLMDTESMIKLKDKDKSSHKNDKP